MTRIPLDDTRSFCIDNHETTQAQYAKFVADKAAWEVTGQPPKCEGVDRKPKLTSGPYKSCQAGSFTPDASPNRPVTCVSWCDANAYCAWAGKRLCGRADGKPLVPDVWNGSETSEEVQPANNEWVFACSGGGKASNGVPDEKAAECPLANKPQDPLKPDPVMFDFDAAAPAQCHPADKPFDAVGYLAGGVDEWVGAPAYEDTVPKSGATVAFALVAATWGSAPTQNGEVVGVSPCKGYGARTVDSFSVLTGIRCCAD